MNTFRALQPADQDRMPVTAASPSSVIVRPFLPEVDGDVATSLLREQILQNLSFSLSRFLLKSVKSWVYILTLTAAFLAASLANGVREWVFPSVFSVLGSMGIVFLACTWLEYDVWETRAAKAIHAFKRSMDSNSRNVVLVATIEGRYVGFIWVKAVEDVHEAVVVVHANHQQDAVYPRMLSSVLDKLAQTEGSSKMVVQEWQWQQYLCNQLERFGFHQTKKVEQWVGYGNGTLVEYEITVKDWNKAKRRSTG